MVPGLELLPALGMTMGHPWEQPWDTLLSKHTRKVAWSQICTGPWKMVKVKGVQERKKQSWTILSQLMTKRLGISNVTGLKHNQSLKTIIFRVPAP